MYRKVQEKGKGDKEEILRWGFGRRGKLALFVRKMSLYSRGE